MNKELTLIIIIGCIIGIILSAFGLGIEDGEFWFWCISLNIINALVCKRIFRSEE